jgi:hypothetical protein
VSALYHAVADGGLLSILIFAGSHSHRINCCLWHSTYLCRTSTKQRKLAAIGQLEGDLLCCFKHVVNSKRIILIYIVVQVFESWK